MRDLTAFASTSAVASLQTFRCGKESWLFDSSESEEEGRERGRLSKRHFNTITHWWLSEHRPPPLLVPVLHDNSFLSLLLKFRSFQKHVRIESWGADKPAMKGCWDRYEERILLEKIFHLLCKFQMLEASVGHLAHFTLACVWFHCHGRKFPRAYYQDVTFKKNFSFQKGLCCYGVRLPNAYLSTHWTTCLRHRC